MFTLSKQEGQGLVLAPDLYDKLTPSRLHNKLYRLTSLQQFYEYLLTPPMKSRVNRALRRMNMAFYHNNVYYVPIYRMINQRIGLARSIKLKSIGNITFQINTPDRENFFVMLAWIIRLKGGDRDQFCSATRILRALNKLKDREYFTMAWEKIVGEGKIDTLYKYYLPLIVDMIQQIEKSNIGIVSVHQVGTPGPRGFAFDERIQEEDYEEKFDKKLPHPDQFDTVFNLNTDNIKWLDTLL